MLVGQFYSQDILEGHRQLIIVTTEGFDRINGKLILFERENDQSRWRAVHIPITVVIGRNGFAWGLGLHSIKVGTAYKKEGDGKASAGVFSLGTAFGFAPSSEMKHLRIEYLPLNQFIEAIDDPCSQYYNCIIDRREVIRDWCSSEKMGEEPLYASGLYVHHNFPNLKANRGSAIFLHIWRRENYPTAGCTAMSHSDLNYILSWLDKRDYPVLVQLPMQEYYKLQKEWNLPSLPDGTTFSQRK